MQHGKPAFLDQFDRIPEHLVRFSRKPRNHVRPEHDVRPQLARFFAESDRILPVVPSLHPFQDHVVAGLER